MDNNYDFESSEPVSNGPVQNQPKNNGYVPNGYTPNNNYAPNNYGQNNGKNSGGVPLIAIIGVMAIIILGLIVYIVYQEISASKTPISDVPTTSLADKTYVEDTREDVEEDVVVDKDKDVVEDDEEVVVDKDVVTDKDSENDGDEEKEKTEDKKSDTGIIATNKSNTTNEETAELSDDWKSLEFILAGQKYKLNTDYKNLIDNGWSVDFAGLGYADGYILNKNDKTYSTTDLENEDYSDARVNIGFINLGESARDVSECQFWAISVDNTYTDTPVDFELPGGIKNGSTLAEVEAAYGIPEDENDIYISDSLGYRVYSYSYDYEIHFDLTISDTEGVTGFDYKIY